VHNCLGIDAIITIRIWVEFCRTVLFSQRRALIDAAVPFVAVAVIAVLRRVSNPRSDISKWFVSGIRQAHAG